MSFLKSVSAALFNAFRLLAGPNPQTMQAHGRRQPVVVPEDNPVTRAREVQGKKQAANRAARAAREAAAREAAAKKQAEGADNQETQIMLFVR